MSGSHQPEPDDAELVRRTLDGDARSFDALLVRHEDRVFRVLHLMGVPRQDREDVAQDVFVRVFRHLGRYQVGRPFHSWLYRIAVNASHDYRTRAGRKAAEAPWIEEVDPVSTDPGPDDDATTAALRRRLLGALGRLTDRERAVFVLREFEGLDTKEVARSLGITRVTVRRHHARARERLRTLFDAGDEREKKMSGGD